jgi:glutaredoxin 3
MTTAIIWSKDNCTYCDQAKTLLTLKDIAYEEKKIGNGYTKEQLLEAVPTARTVPQIIMNDKLIGGFTQLQEYLKENNVN